MALGIGDDAALLNVTPGQQLVMASDTLVAGVHFPETASGRQVATRALCVNLSDMAAMGANPRWFTLALTLPRDKANAEWLADFSAGLGDIAKQQGVALVGGDTTSGPLTLTLTLVGEVPAGEALTRGGAGPGDSVFVTGYLGDGAASLEAITNSKSLHTDSDRLLQRFYSPQPQIQAGLKLRAIASACIDISDGLMADLGHICKASGVTAVIQTEQLPIAAEILELSPLDALEWALCGGDDYQLCFTVAADHLAKVDALIELGELDARRIGTINPGDQSISPVSVIDKNKTLLTVVKPGYNHFGN
ncbi:thiamine-phosphate kinase [Porticoccaceae bacterium]|nr:thiamine-phosphate kinase [Porticoccaceae bacterium]MDB9805564.1 thiamine-phosphate kinase [Porticoccaceae bacterium]MDB9949453.1 thiamine-phosphate kinase [Porticoccaceae bacterium]MDB9970473.1 thiamine-phosphate kinase [Porticoccaceae bacterium]MDC0010432.1 thiamine-phosphate kinase [Porticoccaceae bacterium]